MENMEDFCVSHNYTQRDPPPPQGFSCLFNFLMVICSFISPLFYVFLVFFVSNFYFMSQYHQLPLSHPAAAGSGAAATRPPPPPRLILNLLHPPSLSPSHHPPPSPSIHVYTLLFRNETNHPGLLFC